MQAYFGPIKDSQYKKKLIIVSTNEGFTLLDFLCSEGFIYVYYNMLWHAIQNNVFFKVCAYELTLE